ncbi:hypothetical protein A4H97_33005 [Niastella yeongjuensis]|uniref:Polysaccharide lyase n=1 Tax=Niastella yeongjuensis TaxID=354355 RepID=A0A1V9EGA4_9BACT|nr:polysaccharide lyase [Niastella yeongjuensis]OQP45160.1 hypothetical protein A4H97_33005 [Niastella yeongjuensis]SEP48525.1 Polysaccharide lyase [Niastella yeongjuensis]
MKKSGFKRDNLFRSNKRVLSVTLMLTTLAACQKNLTDPIEPLIDDGSASTEMVSTKSILGLGSLIWQETSDGSSFLNTLCSKQTATSYGMAASTNQAFNGTRSARFELRATDPETKGGTRTEISFPTPLTNNFWYSYALYMPSAQYKDEKYDEVISQWHGGGGITPAIALRVQLGHIYMRTLDGAKTDLGVVEKDKWHTYVYHIIHSSGSDGLIEVWKDGQKIVTRRGANMYALTGDFHLPNWKMGIYKSDWNGTKTTTTTLRVLYFDDIKYGSALASLTDMLPVGGSGSSSSNEQPPAPISVTSLVLVNADTEKDVLTISSGSTISLSALKLAKANIRAVTSGTITNVKFELSGTQSKTYTDVATPYTLHGDDRNGNYWYGNWNPPAPGTYTLKATPYDSKGIAGTSKTISFTFSK